MKYLKFYEEENARWPELYGATVSRKWARKALNHLCMLFLCRSARVDLEFGGPRDSGTSVANADGIYLAFNADWLTLAHEFSHVVEFRKYGNSRHDPRLRRLIDKVCTELVRLGWHELDMQEQFEAFSAECEVMESETVH